MTWDTSMRIGILIMPSLDFSVRRKDFRNSGRRRVLCSLFRCLSTILWTSSLTGSNYRKSARSRQFKRMKYATVSVTSTGKWFINILVDDGSPEPKPAQFSSETTIGIDVGLTDFATFSTGEKATNPWFLKKSLQRLRELQRRVSGRKEDRRIGRRRFRN